MDDNTTREAVPVIPLPNEGEGGPVYSGNSNTGATPVIPLPDVGEGGPVYSGNVTTTYPAVTPQYQISTVAGVRFLNASSGYPTFQVYIDGVRAVTLLDEGSTTSYFRIRAGRRMISVRGMDGYTYIEKTMSFPSASTSTVAITNRTGGLDLIRISDPCRVV